MPKAKKTAQKPATSSSATEKALIALAKGFWRGVVPAFLLSAAVWCLVALYSFEQTDPSLNTVSSIDTVQNVAGTYGAIFADSALQAFGMGAYILPLIMILWSAARMRAEPPVLSEINGRSLFFSGITIIIATISSIFVASSLIGYFYPEPLNAGKVGVRMQALLQTHLAAEGTLIAMGVLAIFGLFTLFAAARLPLTDYGRAAFGVGYGLKVLLWKTALALRYLAVMIWAFVSRPHRNKPHGAPKFSTVPEPPEAQPQARSERPVVTSTGRIAPSLGEAALGVEPQRQVQQPMQPLGQVAPEHTATEPSKSVIPAAAPKPAARHGNSHENFQLPTLDLLHNPPPSVVNSSDSHENLQHNARRLEEVLSDFGIRGEIQRIKPGPVVTMYELEPAPGIKTAKIINLADDIARNMRALSVRIATIAGHSELGIELPNDQREMVNMKEILAGQSYQQNQAKLPMILG